MNDAQEPTVPLTPAPTAAPSAGWLSQIPEPVRKYAAQLVLWFLAAAAAFIAARYGLTPPPPTVVVEKPAETPPSVAVEAPTQFYCGRVESYRDALVTKP